MFTDSQETLKTICKPQIPYTVMDSKMQINWVHGQSDVSKNKGE